MWLQLHMHQIIGVDLNSRFFPLSNHPEGEPQSTRGCQTYGEAALFSFSRTLASFSSYSSKVSPIPSSFLIWTTTP
jgi:hypothetical protein